MAGRRKNGTGTVRERKDGRWEGRIIVGYDDHGKAIIKSIFAKTKTECNQKIKDFQDNLYLITGKLPNHAKSSMSFGEWIDLWYQNYCKPNLRENTQDGYENRIYNHIIPSIGHIRLDQLSQSDLQEYYLKLKTSGRLRLAEKHGSGVSDRLVRAIHASCRMALEKATTEGLIVRNPAIGCKLPPKRTREMQILTHEEMQRFLIQAKHDDVYELYLLELTTGLRRGELLGLQWNDLNFKTGELNIKRQISRVNGELVTTAPKTKASIRTVIIPRSVVNVLEAYKPSTNGSKWLFPSPFKEGDEPRDPSSVYKKMQRVLERAECKKIRFHDLRHTFATMALEHGMDVKTLSAIIGHVSSSTTLDVYSHITTEMQIKAAHNIDVGIGKADPKVDEDSIPTPTKREKASFKKSNFKPTDGKIRRSGTGGLYQISDNLWEGNYTPTHPNGKRIKHNVYAKTKEECERKLEEMIKEVRAQIELEKEALNGLSL